MAHEVFISYSRKDYETVRKIKTEIDHEVGINCWMDLDGIESHEQFVKVIVKAINTHDTMIFMMSEDSMQSKWALDELALAERRGKRIVLVRLDSAEMPDEFYFQYHSKDLIDWKNKPQKDKLIRNLKTWYPISVEITECVEIAENTKKKEDNKAKDIIAFYKNIDVKKPLVKFIRVSRQKPYYVITVIAVCVFAFILNRPRHMEIADGAVEQSAQTELTVQILKGHTSTVRSAAFSPDGKQIVSASGDKTARIWDAQTEEQLRTLEGHTEFIRSAAFSPDGKLIVSASLDSTLCLWEVQTGQPMRILKGHTSEVLSAAFSPDGKLIVSASADKTVRIWDVKEEKTLRILMGHTDFVKSAAFSPDGKRIVSASKDNTARIWDAQTGQLLQTLEGHTNSVYSASFSPDGMRIVSASRDKTVRIWDAQTGQLLETMKGHIGDVNSASFSPNGKLIVSASDDKTIRIWDAQTGQFLQILEGHTGFVNSAAFSPDGKRIVSASKDNTVRIWNLPDELVDFCQEKVE